jgi:hypothetical protein
MIEDDQMTSTPRTGLAVPLACAAILLAPAIAVAQPPAAAPAAPAAALPPAAVPAEAPPPTAEERAAMKKRAGAAYNRGLDLLKKGACDARGGVADTTEALNAFLDSLRLVPKPGTTFLAGVCHQALDHTEEALGFYEVYLRIPGIPDDLKVEAQKAVVALRARVGTIDVAESERGAKVVVDGHARGELPVPGPVVATSGKHLVQVFLAGYSPFETTVGVLPGEVTKVLARLTALPRLGRIEVKEKTGQTVDVILDGNVVGRTPWQGRIGEGDHGVALRGDGDIGSSPVAVTIAADKPAVLTIAAEHLDARVCIVPDPSGATVLIDTAFVGRGTFEGRLRPGEHTFKVVADGFVGAERKVNVGPGVAETTHIALVREPAAPVWQKPVDVMPVSQAAPAGGPPAWAWVVGGAGIVALGTAIGFGIDGVVTKNNLGSLCAGDIATCKVSTQAQADAVNQFNAQKNRDLGLFIGLGVAGATLFTVGLVKVVSGRKAPQKDAAALVLGPIAGPRLGGASLGGSF